MIERNWQRSLQAATGYLELGMPEAAARELAEIPPEHRQELPVISIRLSLAKNDLNWPLAAELSQHLVDVQPEQVAWWISLAYSVRRADCVARAETILRQALKLHPSEGIIHYNLACYANVTDRPDEAIEELKHAISLDKRFRQMALDDEDLLTLKDVIATLR